MRDIDPKSRRFKMATLLKELAFISAGVTLIAALFLPSALHRNASEQWPTSIGIVETNGLQFWGQKQGAFYKPMVSYSYAVEGVRHLGTRIKFANATLLEKDKARAWLDARYPVGKQVVVYYDRVNPDMATLVPGAKATVFVCLWFMGMGAGCSIVLWLLFSRYKRISDSI